MQDVRKLLWIGTSDIKDLYVMEGQNTKPLLGVLADLVRCGVEVRLIHAKEPGPAFREDFDKYPELIDGIEELWSHTHHLLIFHGRYCCKARKPDCDSCRIKDRCRYFSTI